MSVFYSVPGVPRGKMERFVGGPGSAGHNCLTNDS